MLDDFDRCYRAVRSRESRFDGWFFTAVTSTGIYCRPSCPARTPKPENVRFFATAAGAQQAGFRACLRCRPDATPGSPEWQGRTDVAARAVKLILGGTVDREGVTGLAARLGYSQRQLHRLLVAEIGTGALALARARRAQTAQVLLERTDLPIAQVALGAGFSSVRQFNETVRSVFGKSPTELRRRRRVSDRTPVADSAQCIAIRLAYRAPLAWEQLFRLLADQAVPGLECFSEMQIRRSLDLEHGEGSVELAAESGQDYVRAALRIADLRDLTDAISRCRRLLDLDADPASSDGQLGDDALLGPLVRMAPGTRVPGTVDGFELAVRAILAQNVSASGARARSHRLLLAAGAPLVRMGTDQLTHRFPTPAGLAELAQRSPTALPVPERQRRAIGGLAEAVATGEVQLEPGEDPDETRRKLTSLPGVGDLTARYIAMRALGDPDGFLAADRRMRAGARRCGHDASVAGLKSLGDGWSPWRAYAVAHLWSAGSMP